MGFYGREHAYFKCGDNRYFNTVWMELIGFDNTQEDYGVKQFVDTMGVKPDAISFHLTSIDLINTHRGMEKETLLPVYACSYSGHTNNDDRARQDWTNWQLKGLVDSLHKNGIQAFASFFDLEDPSGRNDLPVLFSDLHPELRCVDRDGISHQFLYMIKRMADGTPYLDFLKPRMIAFVNDIGLDGVQLADGISSPRMSLEASDYSDDIVERFLDACGLSLPESLKKKADGDSAAIRERADWIYGLNRSQWLEFMTGEWRHFVTSLIRALCQNGTKAAFNSAWTKDPLEALYRYGADYRAYEEAGANNFVVEDVSADLAILGEDENGYHMGYSHRRFVHYEFAANLMCNKAALPKLKMTPLSMIRDTLEQWDVLHHMPCAMQRAAATNLNNFLITEAGREPVTNGPWFCLGDGLTNEEWKTVRLTWDNGYTPTVLSVPGYTMIWSDSRMSAEIKHLLEKRGWHTAKWLAELLSRGVPVHQIAPIKSLNAVSGPIIVPNTALMTSEERALIEAYQGGEVIEIGITDFIDAECAVVSRSPWQTVALCMKHPNTVQQMFTDDTPCPDAVESLPELVDGIWTHPLRYHPVAEGFLDACAQLLISRYNYPTLSGDYGACSVEQVVIDKKTDRFLIENGEFYYALPTLHLSREIEKVDFLTKPIGYPADIRKNSLRTRIPGRGMEIVEVTYRE